MTTTTEYADTAVFKEDVPVNDRWHERAGIAPLCVGSQSDHTVTFWRSATDTTTREYCVFGTGQAIPGDAEYVGTAIAAGGLLVWHLFARKVPA